MYCYVMQIDNSNLLSVNSYKITEELIRLGIVQTKQPKIDGKLHLIGYIPSDTSEGENTPVYYGAIAIGAIEIAEEN